MACARIDKIIERQMEQPTLTEMEAKQALGRKVLKIKYDLEMALLYIKQAKEVTAVYRKPYSSAKNYRNLPKNKG
jgi:hypothetical protein